METSHLYKKDPKRFQVLKEDREMKLSLPGMETPSLIMNKFHTGNLEGQEIDFAHRDAKVKARLSNSKAKKLFEFIRRSRKQKNATGNTR